MRKRLNGRRLDVVAILLHLTVLSMFGVFVLGAFLTFLDVDTIFLVFKVLGLSPARGSFIHSFLLPFRFVLQSICMYAMARSVAFVLAISVLELKIITRCIKLLQESVFKVWKCSNSDFQKQINVYQCLNIIVSGYLDIFSNPCAFINMAVGLALEVASVFVIIRIRVLLQISPPTYFAITILAVMMPLVANTELPDTIRVAEDTKMMLRNWNLKFTLISKDRKYYIKKLRSLRPCRIYAGLGNVHFYPLVKSTKVTYYSLIIYYVIDALISVPESITLSV
jgi:hypothetical protein